MKLILNFTEGSGLCVLMAGKVYNYGWGLSPSLWAWGSNPTKPNGFGKFGQEISVSNFVAKDVGNGGSHCSTVERLYAWEKRLYQEVKVLTSFFFLPLASLECYYKTKRKGE